jgi:hypothetical protein
VIGDIVALEHDEVGIFDVEFDGSDVLDDEESLGGHELDDEFIFALEVGLLFAGFGFFLHLASVVVVEGLEAEIVVELFGELAPRFLSDVDAAFIESLSNCGLFDLAQNVLL